MTAHLVGPQWGSQLPWAFPTHLAAALEQHCRCLHSVGAAPQGQFPENSTTEGALAMDPVPAFRVYMLTGWV